MLKDQLVENCVYKIALKAKDICKSWKVRIFVLAAVLFLVLFWLFKALLPGSAGEYQIIEIQSQGRTLFLRSLNDSGQAVGFTQSQSHYCAVIWDVKNGIRALATPDGYRSIAVDINNSGEICGDLTDPNRVRHACFWDSEGRIHDIGTLGGRTSLASGLNDHGQIVGLSSTTSKVFHAFLWTKEQGIRDLDPKREIWSYANAINNHEQVVGYLNTSGGIRHAFIWQEETGMVDLHDKLKGDESVACGINNSGQIIGEYHTADNLWRSFVWDKSEGFRDLRIVSEREYGCDPLAINDRGQGIATIHDKRIKRFGFVVQEDRDISVLLDHRLRIRYLHKALPFETNHFTAYDMNNNGQIIVSARKSNYRWYLMTPAVQGD